MALKLVRADDYAVRAMIHLACLPEGSTALRNEIAEAQKSPGSFMAKILRRLVRARLLHSSRGVKGGFCLAKPASEISMLDILEAIEGPLSMARCVPDARGFEWSSECPAAAVCATSSDDASVSMSRNATRLYWRQNPRTIAAPMPRPRTQRAAASNVTQVRTFPLRVSAVTGPFGVFASI